MSTTILTAAIAGVGVASSAAIAYALSRRDEDVILKLRRELQDARDQGKAISRQANQSIKSVRNDIRKSANEHGQIEKKVESGLRSVRDEAYAAIKSADRALALAQSGSSQREKIASDMATQSSSIRADLDRLAQEIRLTNIATVPLISGNTERAMQAINDMNQTQTHGDAATSYNPAPNSTSSAPSGGSSPRWEDNLGRGSIGGKAYDSMCYSKYDKHAKAYARCKSLCESKPECKAINTIHKGCSAGRHKCNLFLDHPAVGSYNAAVHTGIFFDGTPAPTQNSKPATQSNPQSGSQPAAQPEPLPAHVQPHWQENLARGAVGGSMYIDSCVDPKYKHAEAHARCKSWCEEKSECKAVSTVSEGCSKKGWRRKGSWCKLYINPPQIGSFKKDTHTALWIE